MTLTAGVLSQVSVGSNSAQLAATAATGGTGPYTYQWYRSTTNGFSPGGGNILAGATSLNLDDSGLIPNTPYYYKMVATDTGHSNDTVAYSQLAVTTTGSSQNPNQFGQTAILGMIDLRLDFNTVAVEIDVSESGTLYPGSAVKIVDSAGGIPKVVKATAITDDVMGFINYNIKNASFTAGMACEISMAGNCLWLYAGAAFARGAKLMLNVASPGSVVLAAGANTKVIARAYDKASAYGDLVRVIVQTWPVETLAS